MSTSLAKVACVLLTYDRLDYARATIEGLYKHVTPRPHMHIADDGSSDAYRAKLVSVAKAAGAPAVTMSYTNRNGKQSSYGHNFNLATQMTHDLADYLLMLEDDWELRKPLDLSELVADMEAVQQIDCVRLGYLSWTQPMWGQLVSAPNRKYLLLDPNSPEPHVWAGHPRLERISYQREVGPWPEGLAPGETEFGVAHYRRARVGVAWPLGIDGREGYGLFSHIGTNRAW